MATPIIDHNLLTLDYWQDSVTYEGKTVPGGTIGCEALNIPDTLREKLAQASIPLQKIVAAIKENNLTAELLRPATGKKQAGKGPARQWLCAGRLCRRDGAGGSAGGSERNDRAVMERHSGGRCRHGG